MAEPARVAVHRSIFFRLVAVMLVMAVSLLLTVGGFFFLLVRPIVSEHHGRAVHELTHALAARGFGPVEAGQIAARLDMPIRYEGPAGAWSTAEGVPTLAEVRAGAGSCIVQPAPDGGVYVFQWAFRQPLEEAHTRFVILQLVLIAGVVIAAHAILSRALRPLRDLQLGVARLGEGDLDVAVERRTRDELGALTEAFNGMVRRVREMLRARDQLLLDVSHELRSPLTRMRVAIELLPPGDKTERLLADVAELEAMVGGLLELERLREGQGLQRVPVELRPLLETIAAGFPGPPGVVVAAGAAGPPEVEADPDRLRVALRNLVENAVKYSLPDSGAVRVSLGWTDQGRVAIEVIDDGPGIPAEDLPRLFEPFFRVDRSRSKRTGGYGLGLSLCRRIVEAHGGEVAARNNVGARGATFTITLPARG